VAIFEGGFGKSCKEFADGVKVRRKGGMENGGMAERLIK
jgi:hypothetical protein